MGDVFNHGYALLVGVGGNLPVTVKDAQSIHDVLVDSQHAAYPADHVTLLHEGAATHDNILNEFDQFIKQVNADPHATALVYYSGHGGDFKRANQPTEYFLVPRDYDPVQFDQTALKGTLFTEKISALNAQKLIVMLDCCHAAGVPAVKDLTSEFTQGAAPPTLLQAMEQGSGQVVIASSRSDESSYAAVNGGVNSVFTEVLLEALAGRAAREADGFARVLDVIAYLFAEVPARSPVAQHPFVNKIAGLSENFALCYYAGGAKDAPGMPAAAAHRAPVSTWQRFKLESERDSLMAGYNIRRQKISYLEKGTAILADSAFKFQVEQELLQERLKVDDMEKQLDDINNALQKLGV